MRPKMIYALEKPLRKAHRVAEEGEGCPTENKKVRYRTHSGPGNGVYLSMQPLSDYHSNGGMNGGCW